MRNLPFYPLLIAILIGLGGYLGCDPGAIAPPINPVSNTASSQIQLSVALPERTRDTMLLGSFNLRRLGPSKMADAFAMDALAKIIQQFDLIALQEITDNSGAAIQRLMQLVNQGGRSYALAISPRIGRPTSGYYEQYAFVFDTTRIAGGQEFCYLVNDEMDLLHREPYVGRFQTKAQNPFSFSLINVHTDPDEIRSELDVLASVFQSVRDFEYRQLGHDDVIILGDFNAGPGRLQNLERIPGLESLITIPTNTRGKSTLDNIMLDRGFTSEFTGRAGAIDLLTVFGIGLDQALKISDHLPVWGEFYMSRRANQPAISASLPTGVSR